MKNFGHGVVVVVFGFRFRFRLAEDFMDVACFLFDEAKTARLSD